MIQVNNAYHLMRVEGSMKIMRMKGMRDFLSKKRGLFVSGAVLCSLLFVRSMRVVCSLSRVSSTSIGSSSGRGTYLRSYENLKYSSPVLPFFTDT